MTMSQAAKGGVDRVDVRGQVDGIQLEAGEAPAAPDSTKPKPATPSAGRVRP